MLYMPDYNEQTFTSEITGLHPVSKTEMAVFLNDEIWVCTKQDTVFVCSKSKLPLGIPFGSTIAGTYEGDATIFMTKRGLATLKYQNFVASTEQNLSFVSDVIYSAIENKTQDLKQVILYKYWLICHNNHEAYVFDLRTGSWWPMRADISIDKFIEIDAKLYGFNGKFYELCVDDDRYFDEDGSLIDWYMTSQKLHFNAINYTKHIANITLYSVLDSDNKMQFNLQVKCYRKKTYTTDIETNEFEVDAIRTYVQRLSFPKVNEFQYKLSSDPQQAIRVPLSLSGFTVKYRIGSQVR
jgi:hypothetical protein